MGARPLLSEGELAAAPTGCGWPRPSGLSRADVLDERHVRPGVRFAVDAYRDVADDEVRGLLSRLTEAGLVEVADARPAAGAIAGVRSFDRKLAAAASIGGRGSAGSLPEQAEAVHAAQTVEVPLVPRPSR